jgi:copper resistance protein D
MLLWLRAAGLVGQAVALGCAVFALVVLRRDAERRPERGLEQALALTAVGALVTVLAQAGLLTVLATALTDGTEWPMGALLGSTVGIGGIVRIAAALATVFAALALRREPASRLRGAVLLGSTILLSLTGALASHALGRTDGQAWLLIVSALHQAAVGIWVGGLVCATMLVLRARPAADDVWLRPFSALAATAAAGVAVTGIALLLAYVATPGAAIGTSYGAMVLAKIVLFMALLAMAVLNHRALHGRLPLGLGRGRGFAPGGSSLPLRRRLEVEAGLAVVAVLLAASIGSTPPAVDVEVQQRATLDEIRAVFTPQWPRLSSPSLADLAAASNLADPDAPRTAEDTAWSEFGHNVAGLFVLAMGVLATLERAGRARWARHWPLLIIGLAVFVAYSLDPEGWQTGGVGFWEHLLSAEVFQHRIMLLLTALFGFAEWRVRSGRHPDSPWRYVFPVVAIWSGVLLLAHVHEVSDGKSAFFMEISHLLLGLTSLLAGWSRWLELRLPPADSGGPGRIWGPALAVFGLLLILYREG